MLDYGTTRITTTICANVNSDSVVTIPELSYYYTYTSSLNWTSTRSLLIAGVASAEIGPYERGSASAAAYFKTWAGYGSYPGNCSMIMDGLAAAKIGVTALTSTTVIYATTTSPAPTGPAPASAVAAIPTKTPPPSPLPAQQTIIQATNGAPTITTAIKLGTDDITATIASFSDKIVINDRTLSSTGAVETLSNGVVASWGLSGLAVGISAITSTLSNGGGSATVHGVSIGSQTLTSGGVIVASGTTYSFNSGGSVIGVGSGTTITLTNVVTGTSMPSPSSSTNKGVPGDAPDRYGDRLAFGGFLMAFSVLLLI